MKKIVIFIPLILGSLVGLLLMNSFSFYDTLVKPWLAPPKWLFPIVWPILYLLMWISYYLVRKYTDNKTVRDIYYIQLFLNLMWSILFFIFEQLFLSSIWIIFLDLIVIVMISLFNKINKISSYLQIPYLLWLLFATYLNISICILNL